MTHLQPKLCLHLKLLCYILKCALHIELALIMLFIRFILSEMYIFTIDILFIKLANSCSVSIKSTYFPRIVLKWKKK